MLTKARKDLLNNNNVAILNIKVISKLSIQMPDKKVVIVQ